MNLNHVQYNIDLIIKLKIPAEKKIQKILDGPKIVKKYLKTVK